MVDVKLRIAGVAVVLAFLLSMSLAVPGGKAQHEDGWVPTIITIPTPAGANTGEARLTVSDRGVLLSWIEHAGSMTTLRFSERTATGWTEPRAVASGEDWSVSGIDAPSVLRLGNGTLAAQWLKKIGRGVHAKDLRVSSSRDDGRTWAASFTLPQDGTQERIFPSMFEMPGSQLGLIWLAGRAMQADPGAAEKTPPAHGRGADHAHQHGGAQPSDGRGAMGGMGGKTSLRFARFDGAWKQTADTAIDPRVCECCSTAVAVTSEGTVAAFRNRSDDEIRDIYVSRLEQGRWSEPVAVHADNWRIPGCPINGPALTARGRDVAVAWFTVKQDQGQVYAAFSRDAGRTFGTPIRVDDHGSTGRVDIAMLPAGSAVVAWMDTATGQTLFRVRRVTVDGNRSPAVSVATLGGNRFSASARIARHGNELVFAWTDAASGAAQVRTAVARLPVNMAR